MPGGLYEVNDRGFQQALERRLLIRDDVGFTCSPELTVVLDVGCQELRYHLGWKRYAVTTQIVAVAAQFARLRIVVPAAANIIAQLDYVSVSATANMEVGAAYVIGAPGNLATVVGGAGGSGIVRDARQGTATNAVGGNAVVSKTTDAAAQVPTIFDGFALANTTFEIPIGRLIDYYLLPGVALDFFLVSPANQTALLTIAWQERMLNDQENVP